jgi:Sulfotransferase family
MDDPIFIVGPHRAGSTLWHNLVAMCPDVLRLAEPRFLGAPRQRDFRSFLRDYSDGDPGAMVERLFSRKRTRGLEGAFWRFEGIEAADNPRLKEAVGRRIKEADRSLREVARILIEELTVYSNNTRACVKFPVDLRQTARLLEWFPKCRIVHITRDPRALAMSKSNDPSGTALKIEKHPGLSWLLRKAALLHVVKEYRVAAGIHERLKHSHNYRLFKYEDLLAWPRETIKELCEFIGVEFTPDMLAPEKGRHEHQPSSLTGEQKKAFDTEAAVRWRKVISRIDNFAILILTKTSMRRLGYDPDAHPIFQRSVNFTAKMQAQRAC